jgi:hypothetical protein
VETIISVVALVISLFSIGWQALSWRKTHEQERLGQNISLLADIKMQLAEMPEAFRFHGITKEQMKQHGVTGKELAYLVANFMAGQVYFETIDSKPSEPFGENLYRTRICETESFQKAWPLVKMLLDDTPYRQKVQLTVERYENS